MCLWTLGLKGLRYGKTANKNYATCLATLLQNELTSDVARFTTHHRLLTGLNMGCETHNIAIQLLLQRYCKTKLHVSCCPFYRSFRELK